MENGKNDILKRYVDSWDSVLQLIWARCSGWIRRLGFLYFVL